MATSEQERNVEGQTTAITVFSTVRWWGRFWLPVLFWFVRRVPALTKTLRELSFIHFARWCIVDELPYNGPPQRSGKLHYRHMFFESNFNGSWSEYIDAFSHKLTSGMTAFWGSSYGFPKPLPTGPFKEYIRSNETAADHFYSAYPEATSTMVQRALTLDGFVPAARESKSTNVSGQAYAFMAMLPVTPGLDYKLTSYLRALDPSPFASLPRTHFARFVVITDFHNHPSWKQRKEEHLDLPYLIVTSNFDGDLDSYLDELCASPEVVAMSQLCVGCPKPATPSTLKAYFKHNQIQTGVFFAAYGGATVEQVHAALEKYPPESVQWPSKTPGVRIHVKRAVDLVREAYERDYVPGSLAKRDQHADEYGTLRGTLTVASDLPPEAREGIFATPGVEYPVIARLSPNGPVPWPLRSPIGMAVKVLLGDGQTQDFLFGNSKIFFCASAADAVEMVKARANGGLALARFFLSRPRELRNVLVTMADRTVSPLDADYHSQLAMRYGPHIARLSARSQQKAKRFVKADRKALLWDHLAKADASFDFAVQFQSDPVTQPNDPTQPWPETSPPIVVGKLHFPSQVPTDGEHLEFTLAHSLPEHETADEIGEVRVAVYEMVSAMRHRYNQQPRQEPS